MRFLADENFPRPIVDLLRKHGHDVDWARNLYPGIGDKALIEQAEADGLVIITFGNSPSNAAIPYGIPGSFFSERILRYLRL